MIRTAAIAALIAASAFAQGKTDFSGTWKLNVAKSDFGPIPTPDSRTDVIEQTADGLKETVAQKGEQGDMAYTMNLKFDGSEVVNKGPGDRDFHNTAQWDGPALVVGSKFEWDGNPIESKSHWTLSDDRNTLTQNVHASSSQGEIDLKYVFERQGAAATPTATASAAPTPAPAANGPRPNLSGTWKLNVAKSDFGPFPAPVSRIDNVEENAPVITVKTVQEDERGKHDLNLKFTTDGKEAVNSIMGREVKGTATWEGNNLVVLSKLVMDQGEVTIKSVYGLTPDGKTMNVNSHIESPMGEVDQKMVMEKQ